MRRLLFATLAVAAGACGSGSDPGGDAGVVVTIGGPGDNAPAFVGTWSGTLTQTETAPTAGPSMSNSVSFAISEPAANTLTLADVCTDGSGPNVTVTSATQFAGGAPFSCPPFSITECTSVVITFSNITGMLSAGALTFGGSATAVGCNTTVSENFSFDSGSNTKK